MGQPHPVSIQNWTHYFIIKGGTVLCLKGQLATLGPTAGSSNASSATTSLMTARPLGKHKEVIKKKNLSLPTSFLAALPTDHFGKRYRSNRCVNLLTCGASDCARRGNRFVKSRVTSICPRIFEAARQQKEAARDIFLFSLSLPLPL